MWELPARSMPGSEIVFVENTRMRGTRLAPAAGASIVVIVPASWTAGGVVPPCPPSRSVLPAAPDEDPVVAVGLGIAEELVADLRRPRGDVGLRDRVGGPQLDDRADGDLGHALLGLEERAGAGSPAGVDDLLGGDGCEVWSGEGVHRVL